MSDQFQTAPAAQIPLHRSIVLKLAIFVAAVVALTVSFVGWVAYRSTQSTLRDRVHQQLKLVAADRGAMLEMFVAQQHERIALVASRTRLRQLMKDHAFAAISSEQLQLDAQPILIDAQQSATAFEALWLTDREGLVIAATDGKMLGRDLSKDADFRRGLVASHLSVPHFVAGEYHVHVAKPAIASSGEQTGVVMGTLNAEVLIDLLKRGAELGETGEILIGTLEDYDVHYLLPSSDRGLKRVPADTVRIMAEAIGDELSGFGPTTYGGQEVLAAWRPIAYQPREFQPWGLVVKMSVAEAYEPVDRMQRTLTWLVAGCLVVGVLASCLLARRLSRPILKVAQTAAQVAHGDLKARIKMTSEDEIGTLAASFNHMARELEASHANLEHRIEARTHELAMANVELVEAKDAALAASRAKNAFVANMSHEIRTPMNAILGMTNLVLESEITPTQREYLKIVLESGESLLTLINDILDFSKIEAGKFELDQAPFRVRERLGDAVKSLAVRAHTKGLELAFHIHPSVPDVLVGDAHRLRQIAVNLLGNAIKFTDHGEIVLDVVCEAINEGVARLHFQVIDTGIGISADKLEAIFKPFEQADTSTSRKYGGTGLGLTISARLVDLMHGRLWVESEVGQGSRFHFTADFPVSLEGPPERVKKNLAAIRNMRVLVVDDNATNRLILDEMLGGWSMETTLANSAAQGLDALQTAHEAGQSYQLVITDLHMPLTDGFGFIESVRQDPAISGTPLLMLSSGVDSSEWTRCKQLNVPHLMKPVKQSELFDAIMLMLGMANAEEHAAGKIPVPQALKPQRILLAEDSIVIQTLAVSLLAKHGHLVTVATTGAEVLKLHRNQRFDVILMDVQMPEMDGLETTRIIRRSEAGTREHIPIIAMTAHAMVGDREQCLAAGMDDYVSKPIRSEQLFEVLRRVLAAPNTLATDDSTGSTDHGGEVVDWAGALRHANGDRKLLSELSHAFMEECPQKLAQLRIAVQSNDLVVRRRVAHSLKNTLRAIGATAAAELALHLEFVESSTSTPDALKLVSELEVTCEQVLHRLRDWLRGDVTL